MKKSPLSQAIIVIVATCFPVAESVADVYRWVDKNTGEIFFAEKPPPPEISTDYENITPQLEKRVLKRATVAKQPTVTTDTPRVNSKPIVILEVSPNPDSSKSQVISDRDLLIKHRCLNFSQQINSLEQLISKATDPDEMDNFFLKLVEYEKSYIKNCKNSSGSKAN